MGTTVELKWIGVPPNYFTDRGSEIRVRWQQDFHSTDTKVRQLEIESNSEWELFSRNCFLPWYKNNLQWSHPNAENLSLMEAAQLLQEELKPFPDIPILSVFHTSLKKRIIVDGCHRSVALQREVSRKIQIPKIKIIDAYGSQVHSIFYCDFCNLVAKALNPFPQTIGEYLERKLREK